MAKKKVTTSDKDLFLQIAAATGGEVLSEMASVKYFVDTGNLAVNYQCSGKYINGGLPGGRITEIYGPSSSGKSLFANNVLHGCQKLGGIPMILDCENATNNEFMERANHLNLDRVLWYAPTSLESTFRKVHTVAKEIRKKIPIDVPIVAVYDSISVSPCERELKENDLPEDYKASDWKKIVGRKEQPGERAKVCGNELRKLQAVLGSYNITVVIINQIREKIGIMFGCFQYDSRVVLADGSTVKIGKIVNQNMVGLEVLSFNPDTGVIEPKKITAVHDNGNLEEGEQFLQFTVRKRGGNGRTQFACTSNHRVFVPKFHPITILDGSTCVEKNVDEVEAGTLKVGDEIMVMQPFYLSEDQKQVVYGSVLGDGEIRTQNEGSCSQLRIGHGAAQTEYCQWKEQIFNPWIGYSYIEENKLGFDTIPMFELIEIGKYKNDYNVPNEVLDNLSPLGLAIWYMDDGSYRAADKWGNGQAMICCTKFRNRSSLKDMLERKFGILCSEVNHGLKFNSENTKKLHSIIAQYIHPSMDYKLHYSFRGQFQYEIIEPDGCFQYKAVTSEILDIYEKPPTRSKKKFDITIEDNHSYIVDGAIVHNSPETTGGGGKSLEFYCSCRLRTQAKKKIENKKLATFAGINLQVKNIKNKTHRPFIVVEDVKLYFESGIDPLTGLLQSLRESKRIEMVKENKFKVMPEYAPDDKEYLFTAKLTKNSIPMDVILDCPKLIDAESREQVEEYLADFKAALESSGDSSFSEKELAFSEDGEFLEGESEDEE